MTEWWKISAVEHEKAIKTKKITSIELTEYYIKRIEYCLSGCRSLWFFSFPGAYPLHSLLYYFQYRHDYRNLPHYWPTLAFFELWGVISHHKFFCNRLTIERGNAPHSPLATS